MAHDVFISYSNENKTIADALCHWVDALPEPETFFSSIAGAIARQLNEPLVEKQSSPVISSPSPCKKTRENTQVQSSEQ